MTTRTKSRLMREAEKLILADPDLSPTAAFGAAVQAEANRQRALRDAGASEARRGRRVAARPAPSASTAAPPTTVRPGLARAAQEQPTMKKRSVSFASFLRNVRNAVTGKAPTDPQILAAAPTNVNREGVGTDGGYLVPPDVRTAVADAVLGELSLLGLTDLNRTDRNAVYVPENASPSWLGPTPSITAEGAAFPQVKMALKGRTLQLHKLAVLLPASDELLEDGGPALKSYLTNAVSERLLFSATNLLLNGDGVGNPLGLLKSGALIVQEKETSQTADTINFPNVRKMWRRLYGPCRARAVWLANPDAEEQLQGMTTPGGSPVLVYPPDSPCGYLLGRPLLVSEACAAQVQASTSVATDRLSTSASRARGSPTGSISARDATVPLRQPSPLTSSRRRFLRRPEQFQRRVNRPLLPSRAPPSNRYPATDWRR